MSIQTPWNPVHGIIPMTAPDPTAATLMKTPIPKTPDTSVRVEDLEVNDLSRLARLVRSNEQLVERLHSASDRLRGVLNYLERADANFGLGLDYYRYWRAKHTIVLTMLRANRIEARRLLTRLDPELPEGSPVVSGS